MRETVSYSLPHCLTYSLDELAGDHTEGETPDPIPNSEVKPLRADGSDSARDRESRSSPAFFFCGARRDIYAAGHSAAPPWLPRSTDFLPRP